MLDSKEEKLHGGRTLRTREAERRGGGKGGEGGGMEERWEWGGGGLEVVKKPRK
jgi:hypothetical protein